MSSPATRRKPEILPESLSASGKSAEKLSLPDLQSKMKKDPEGYESELLLLYEQFKASMALFQQQAALSFTTISGIPADPSVARDLGDRAMILSHVTPFYPKHLSEFPKELADFLRSSARSLPAGLRSHVAQALILLINRKVIGIRETLELFMELQTVGDRNVRKLAFNHVIQSIRKMNLKHKNEAQNRPLQNVLYAMLQQEDEIKSKRALATLCELHRRKVWFDERTANAICTACFHSSSRIMVAALSFLLDYEKIQDDEDSDNSDSDNEVNPQNLQVALSREAVYKAHNQGTQSSKKKKKAKLQRAMRSLKRQQRLSSEKTSPTYYSPLNHLNDAQGFAEKLFSRLQSCHERFEVKMMMLKVIARTIGLHGLIVLNFYPFMQKYIQPHQRDITNLLAAAVQACHDMVPPDAVEPMFKQIVNQFVHDRSRNEAIAVGLNVVREICLRIPLLMTEELLQDLVQYKKNHEKAISAAARSLITLFREICPSLLIKKDRGRPTDPKAKPKAYGERTVTSNVAGVELLSEAVNETEDESEFSCSEEEMVSDDGTSETDDIDGMTDDGDGNDTISAPEDESPAGSESDSEADDIMNTDDQDEVEDTGDDDDDDDNEDSEGCTHMGIDEGSINLKKRKLVDFDASLLSADASLRTLKKLASDATRDPSPLDPNDGILSNEDFHRIKQLKASKDAKIALGQRGARKGTDAGLKVPTQDQLRTKRVDAAELMAHVKEKLTKEQRLAHVREGREGREKYQARAAVKQKKSGGLSNRQKEHKKAMPLAAKRSKIAKSRVEKKRKHGRLSKQFRGKKAWK
ncbi:hypothetical protein QQ045_017325 [Rhodiola kirilowii]